MWIVILKFDLDMVSVFINKIEQLMFGLLLFLEYVKLSSDEKSNILIFDDGWGLQVFVDKINGC